MATEGGGKMKPRRQHQDSRPYDRRQSLLGRMKDTVKDMLSPSWVIDLVNGVRKTPPPNSDQQELSAPQVHPQQPDGEVRVRRELNRMGNEESMMMNQGMPPQQHTSASSTQQGNLIPPYSTPQMTYNTYRPPAPIPQHIMTNGDDQSDANEYSGPGSMCPNMIPLDRKDYQNEMLQLNESRIRQMQQQMELHSESISTPHNTSTDSVNASSASDGSFLWSNSKPRSTRPQPPAKGQNPSFNITAFNSSLVTPKDPSFRQSPYYPGKTTFGGAAAHRKSRVNQSLPYELSPMRKEVRARPLNNSALGGVTSSTAKRILDTLERMSSPLSDAKKIPFDANASDSVLSLTPGIYRRRRVQNSSMSQSFSESSAGGPPVARINTPSFASIATNRQTYPIPLPSQTASETTSKTVAPSSTETQAQQSNADKGNTGRSGKMKRDRGTHYSSKQEEEEVEVPNLPTSFTLPVSSMTLPKFDFGVPKSTNDTTKTSDSARINSSPKSAPFTFASPIVEANSPQSSYSDSKSQNFQFSSPLSVDANGPKLDEMSSSPGMQFAASTSAPTLKRKQPEVNFKPPAQNNDTNFKPAAELKSGSVMDILGKPSTDLKKGSVMDILGKTKPTPNGNIGELQPASSLKSGSVMDILGKPSAGSASGQSLSSIFKKSEGDWSCDTCLIKNRADVVKCVACESAKPSPKPAGTSAAPTSGGSTHNALLGKTAGEWTCDTCLIKNKSDVSRCVACEAPKPGPKSTSSGGSGLGGLFKKSDGEWTCDTCLIKNKSGVTKCVACETPKPGPKMAGSGGASLGGIFKKAEGEWTCDTCLIKNKAGVSKCAACETPKPGQVSGGSSLGGLLKTTQGEWTCDTCLIKNKPEVTKCAACETPKPGAKPAAAVKPADNTKTSIGFGNLSKKASGTWECDTCLVSNKAEANKCIACETPKPGSKPTTGFTSSGGFKFAPSGGFGFGAPASSSTPTPGAPATSGFSFGGSSTSAPTKTDLPTASFSMPKEGGFSFGKSSDKAETKTEQPASIPTLQFNTKTPDTSAKPKAAADTDKPVFGGFGVNNTQDSSAKESNATGGFKFGAPAAATEKKTPEASKPLGVHFGIGSTESAGVKTEAAPAGGFNFQFGKTNNTDKSVTNSANGAPFQFGQTVSKDINKNDSKPLGAGGFQFPTAGGNKKDIAATPVFSFNAKTDTNATSQPQRDSSNPLLFGDSKKSESQPKPVFGSTTVNDKPTLPTGGFQFGAAATSTPSVTGFVFGATNTKPAETSNAAAPSSNFTFGASGNRENKNTPSSTFSFGTTAGKPSEAPSSGGFTFNTAPGKGPSPNKRVRDDMEGPGEAKKASFAFANTASEGTFKFGDKPASNTNAVPASGFSFGQNNPPAFGAAKTDSAPQSGGFGSFSATSGQTSSTIFGGATPASSSVFGSTPATAFGSSTSAPAPAFGSATTTASSTGGINLNTPSGFNFGGSSTTPSTGLFQFSASNNQAAPAGGANSGFSFDQSATPSQPAAPTAAAAPSFNATPAINFTGQAQGPGMFNFSAAGNNAAPENPFSASGASNSGARRFKKAVRKLRK